MRKSKPVSGHNVVSLLTMKAARAGLDPDKLPAIQQVSNIIATGNRGRAAQVAKNVRNYVRTKMPQVSHG
jgi:hypothetical protein